MLLCVAALLLGSNATEVNNLAAQQYFRGNLKEAERLYRVALAAEPSDVAAAKIKSNLAALLKRQYCYAGAEELYRSALELRRSALGAAHPDGAITLNNIGEVCRLQGKYREAGDLFGRALAILENAGDARNPDLPVVMNNLAVIERVFQRYERAEKLLRAALRLKEETFGPDSAQVAVTLNSLATVLEDVGDPANAGAMYARALGILERAGVSSLPDLVATLTNLGRLTASEALHKRALLLIGDQDAPLEAAVLHNLGNLYAAAKRPAEADAAFSRCLSIRENILGRDHPLVADVLADYARLLRGTGKKGKAHRMEQRAQALLERQARENWPQYTIDVRALRSLR